MEFAMEHDRLCRDGRVEGWRADVRVWWLFRRFRSGPQTGSRNHASSPCSSNRTCGFPASGSQSGSCLRTRKVPRHRRKASQAVVQPCVEEWHVVPLLHLSLSPQPLSQPPGRVCIYGRVGRANLPDCEVVCPSGHHPIEAPYDLLCSPTLVPPGRLLTNPTADALNARPARSRADVPASVRRTIVPADAISKELKRLLRAPGLLDIDR